jgi:hypothetical protein
VLSSLPADCGRLLAEKTEKGFDGKRGVAMSDTQAQIAELLHEAGETHHQVYRITDGVDADWASWYAVWLIRLSELPKLLGTAPVRSELVYILVKLDKDFTRNDRLETRSQTFLLRNEPEQARNLVLASRLCRHFLKVGWIKTSIGLTD